MSSSSNPTEAAYKSAVEKLGLKSNIARALEIPDRELKVEIPFRRDNGEIDSVVGYRVQLNSVTYYTCLLYTSPSPRDQRGSRMPSSA